MVGSGANSLRISSTSLSICRSSTCGLNESNGINGSSSVEDVVVAWKYQGKACSTSDHRTADSHVLLSLNAPCLIPSPKHLNQRQNYLNQAGLKCQGYELQKYEENKMALNYIDLIKEVEKYVDNIRLAIYCPDSFAPAYQETTNIQTSTSSCCQMIPGHMDLCSRILFSKCHGRQSSKSITGRE
jgi:hypothetical protein